MFIATETTENIENDSDTEIGTFVERETGKNTELSNSTEEVSNTINKAKGSKGKKCRRPKWPKFPYYKQRTLGYDSLETIPRRCHKHTIIF